MTIQTGDKTQEEGVHMHTTSEHPNLNIDEHHCQNWRPVVEINAGIKLALLRGINTAAARNSFRV